MGQAYDRPDAVIIVKDDWRSVGIRLPKRDDFEVPANVVDSQGLYRMGLEFPEGSFCVDTTGAVSHWDELQRKAPTNCPHLSGFASRRMERTAMNPWGVGAGPAVTPRSVADQIALQVTIRWLRLMPN